MSSTLRRFRSRERWVSWVSTLRAEKRIFLALVLAQFSILFPLRCGTEIRVAVRTFHHVVAPRAETIGQRTGFAKIVVAQRRRRIAMQDANRLVGNRPRHRAEATATPHPRIQCVTISGGRVSSRREYEILIVGVHAIRVAVSQRGCDRVARMVVGIFSQEFIPTSDHS